MSDNRPDKYDTLRIARRDGPFGDYCQAPAEAQPRRRSELKRR